MLDRRVEITKTLRATPVVLRTLVRGVDDGRLRRRPAPREWAIIEVVAHLADTEERALGRVRRMLAEEDPQLAPFDQHLDLLDGLDGPGWERTGRHGQHGVMSVELYETHAVAEEVDHLAQIARLL
jgi:DinB superfamily